MSQPGKSVTKYLGLPKEPPLSTNVTVSANLRLPVLLIVKRSFDLTIIEASSLSIPGLLGLGRHPKAYVKIEVEDKNYKTAAARRGANPAWNQIFPFTEVAATSRIEFRVFHEGTFRHILLSSCSAEVQKLLQRGENQLALTLQLHAPDSSTNQTSTSLTVRVREDKSIAKTRPALDKLLPERPSGVDTVLHVVDAAQAVANTPLLIPSISESLGTVMNVLERFVQAGDQLAQVHALLNVAWQVIKSLYELTKAQIQRDERVAKLALTIHDHYATLDMIQDIRKEKGLEDVLEMTLKQTVECAWFIRQYIAKSFGGRLIGQVFSDADEKIEGFEAAFRNLRESFRDRSLAQITLVTLRAASRIDTLYLKEQLRPVHLDPSIRSQCLPGTRGRELRLITDWVESPDEENRVLWLPGQAGFGKSTLATTLALSFATYRRLGSFMFFDRDVSERSDPSRVIETLAFQLALFDSRISEKITEAVNENSTLLSFGLQIQFKELLVKPLSSVESLSSAGPIVLVLDALDECGNEDSRAPLLSVLAEDTIKLPSCVRIVIMGRPSEDIELAFEGQPHITRKELVITSENSADVDMFLRHSMNDLAKNKRHPQLGPGWPGDKSIDALSLRAGGFFLWAGTATRYISRAHNPDSSLDAITSGRPVSDTQQSLTQLYVVALRSSGKWEDEDFCLAFRRIIGIVLVASVPLSSTAIDKLLSLEPDSARRLTARFNAVLTTIGGKTQVFHPTFYEFLTDQSDTEAKWFIDTSLHNRTIAFACIDVLERTLKENICGLPPSWEPTPDSMSLPEEVSYACTFWIGHVVRVLDEAEPLLDRVHKLLNRHLLHWLEAMSILRQTRQIAGTLQRLLDWIMKCAPGRVDLANLIEDSHTFCRVFANGIEEHPLFLYRFALPFAPPSSAVYKQFFQHKAMPRVMGGNFTSWASLAQLESTLSTVYSIAFSPDGLRIASGSFDEQIRIWDVATGAALLAPFRGHGDVIYSVAFSPNGSRIVSASADRTIRVWDVNTGAEVFAPLQGHGGAVLCAAFSPDGSTIVSGSSDRTIRLWDAPTGAARFKPMQGHDDVVYSTAFSPDGSRIVSASADKTIRVWDVGNHVELLVLRGHTEGVLSAVFSPDGARVVSGSFDETVRVWDSMAGNAIFTLKGHEHAVWSAAFSPDGTRVVSGSLDKSIRIWDAKTGCLLPGPSRTHDNGVYSVAYSPDASRIISGSGDQTIRIWNARAGEEPIMTLRGRDDSVRSLAFSPDGSRVISGSKDCMVRVWDASTGSELFSPLQGHADAVYCVAFSPDGSKFASGSWDKTIVIWDTASGSRLRPTLRGHDEGVLAVAFSPDGRRIVSGSYDKTIRVWDVLTGAQLLPPFRGHTESIFSVTFSLDGSRVISGSNDSTVRIWDTHTGKEAVGPLLGHTDGVFSVSLSADGKRMASSSYDESIRIWDSTTGLPIGEPFLGHEYAVWSATFIANDTMLVSGSFDKTIRLWDAKTGAQLFEPLQEIMSQPRPRPRSSLSGRASDSTISIHPIKLPTYLGRIWSFAAHSTAVAVGLGSGTVLIISFPAAQ
ncbi:hypothetical protein BOTBODRAFT_189671 [Botryobasidium botryosum FD-172 SS1]|uniref:C2 domain-containing protein n=1 Tax=Botryobasidium botryosum (strain FD-172 SS1) TaxID=930990 RepID=A0A067MIF4_BOTB1|nr:hypothetical protein BOTBODRAFT_189671 [Botryobasidium botryosum FD-172 SS1]